MPHSKINKNVCQRETANCNQSSLLIIGCLSENRVQHANVIANDNMNTAMTSTRWNIFKHIESSGSVKVFFRSDPQQLI